MKFTPTSLQGAFIVDVERIEDERGFFARSFCCEEFRAQGLDPEIVQTNLSYNRKIGTLRGLHLQVAPHEEAKLVTCIEGSIFDVIVDVRPGSATFGRTISVELNRDNRRGLFIPKGFAHGFQSLRDDTTVSYQMSQTYHPQSARGILWNDPELHIDWPIKNPIMSDRDATFGPLSSCDLGVTR